MDYFNFSFLKENNYIWKLFKLLKKCNTESQRNRKQVNAIAWFCTILVEAHCPRRGGALWRSFRVLHVLIRFPTLFRFRSVVPLTPSSFSDQDENDLDMIFDAEAVNRPRVHWFFASCLLAVCWLFAKKMKSYFLLLETHFYSIHIQLDDAIIDLMIIFLFYNTTYQPLL